MRGTVSAAVETEPYGCVLVHGEWSWKITQLWEPALIVATVDLPPALEEVFRETVAGFPSVIAFFFNAVNDARSWTGF